LTKILLLLSLGSILAGPSFAQKTKAPPPLLDVAQKAEDPAPEKTDKPVPVVSLFSPEQRPGSGNLTLTIGDKIEKIELGTKPGLYGSGLILHSSGLPAAYRSEFPGMHLIQLALGTLTSHLQKQVPQFSTLTLVTKRIPSKPKTFQIASPQKRPKETEGLALMLLTSPGALKDRTDEEKLSATFIGQTGTIKLVPQGTPEEVQIPGETEKFTFRSQEMQFDLDCELATPFSPQKASLKGTINVAVLWPFGKRAELFAARISSRAVASMNTPGPQTAIAPDNQ
jgi:hypothetical protein